MPSRPLKIAHVLARHGQGGVPGIALSLAAGMNRRGHAADVITWEPGSDWELPADVEHRVVHLSGLSGTTRRSRFLRSCGESLLGRHLWRYARGPVARRQFHRKAIAGRGYDVLFLHGLDFLPLWKYRHVPKFVVAHANKSLMLLSGPSAVGRAIKRFVYGRGYRGNHLIGVSQGVADDLVAAFGVDPARVRCIHNGYDLEAIRRRSLEPCEEAALPRRPFVLAVARLAHMKRLDRLIHAYHRAGVRDRVDLVLVGRGRLESRLRGLVSELGLAQHVHILGWCENAFAFMRRAELFCLTSGYEGFGGTIVEALACGTPVLAMDCPSGPAEILTGPMARGIVPAGDVDAFAAKLRAALDDPLPVDEERLAYFGIDRAVEAYLEAARSLVP